MTAMQGVERLFCDTSVLLCAVDRARPLHRAALRVLNELPNCGVELCVSGQVLRELLVASTRPVEVNGLGLSVRHAMANARAVAQRTTVLDEPREVFDRLLELVGRTEARGKRIHDVNLVGTMLVNEVGILVTDNLAHFRCYQDIEVIDLATF